MAWYFIKHRDFTFYLYFALFMLFSMGDSQRFIIIITIIIIIIIITVFYNTDDGDSRFPQNFGSCF